MQPVNTNSPDSPKLTLKPVRELSFEDTLTTAHSSPEGTSQGTNSFLTERYPTQVLEIESYCDSSSLSAPQSKLRTCYSRFVANAQFVKLKCETQQIYDGHHLSDTRLVLVFICLGCTSYYMWNAIVDCLYAVESIVFPLNTGMGDTLTALFDTFCFLGCIGLVVTGPFYPAYVVTGTILFILTAVAFAATVQFSEDQTVAYVSLGMLCSLSGLICACIETSSYAYSSVCRASANIPAWFSFGIGFAGVLSMIVWNLLTRVVLGETRVKTRASVWVHMMVVAVMGMLSLFGANYFFSNGGSARLAPASAKRVSEQSSRWTSLLSGTSDTEKGDRGKDTMHHQISSQLEVLPTSSALSYRECFNATWVWQIHLVLLTAVTDILFPNICPFGFHEAVNEVDFTTGLFQVADFLGRYIPTLLGCFHVQVSNGCVYTVNLSRLIFIVIGFFIMHRSFEFWLLSSYVFHCFFCLLLGLTHGWIVTECMIRLPRPLTSEADKGRAAAISNGLVMTAIVTVMWTSKFLKIAYY